MKKGYKRLLIFEIILLILFLIIGFKTKIFSGYIKAIIIALLVFLFKIDFGLEKPRRNKSKDVIIELTIFFLALFLIIYIVGIFTGFYRVENYYTIHGIFSIIIPTILIIIATEYLRYSVINKSEGNIVLIILSVLLFIVLDLTQNMNASIFDSKKSMFDFFAFFLLPSISNNIAASYISYNAGIKPNIIWLSVVALYDYLLPIIPQFGNYIFCVLECIIPILLYIRVKIYLDKEKDKKISRDYNSQNIFASIIPFVFLVIVVYLTCGKFKFVSIAIASGSMVPTFHRGDVVIVEKIDDYKKLEVGDVIAFNYGGVITVHRLTIIDIDEEKYYFYTKGDANKSIDSFVLDGKSIIGTVKCIVPYVGYPTVWLSEA